MADTANPNSVLPSECPSQDILLEYFLGMADDFVSISIDTHISTCDACNHRLTELESSHGSLLRETLQSSGVHDSTDPNPEEAQQAIDAAWRAVQQRLHEDLSRGSSPVCVGQYRVLERIGCGGMGSVYRAEHSQLKKVVALKLIPIQWSHPQTLQRFEREIRAAGQLQHPGIVTATDAGTQSGMQYLAMEFVDGLDLGRLSRSISPIPTADACEIARQLSLALSHAHQLGIIHRDIKPSNVMLDSQGRVKLLDFGLVHFHRWDGPVGELTTVGQFLGTLDYMAPEQAERSEVVDARSDLYSLGATLFKLLTSQTPLAMTPHQSPIEKLKRLSQHQPIQLQTLRPDLPSELCDVVNRLLATQPESRLPSALHVAEALQPFCEGAELAGLAKRGLQSGRDGAFDVSVRPAEVGLANPLEHPSPIASARLSPARRLPPVWGWIALALVPVLGYFGWQLILESDQGNLVIESTSDQTKIEIKRRANGTAKEMLVEPGTHLTRLQAGEYDITIHEGSDQISIEPKSVQLRRGETVVARIVRLPKNESSTSQLGANESRKSEEPATNGRQAFAGVEIPESVEKILFKGKTLVEWLNVLERERDPVAWLEAFDAIHIAEPQFVQSLAEPIRSLGLKNNFFRVPSNGWFRPVFSHEEFDQLVLEHMQGKALQECVEVLESIAMLSNTKMRDGVDYQASLLTQSLAFVEAKLSTSAPTSELLALMRNTNAFESMAGVKDESFFKKHPWLEFMAYRLRMDYQSVRVLTRVKTEILSDYSLDLDRFLLLASSFASAPNLDKEGLESFRQHIRHRLADELRRWAESGKLLGGLGMGPTIVVPRLDGISFGRNNETIGGGMGGGGMGGFGGMKPADRIERGIELLALCSRMPLEQRPIPEIEQLIELIRPVAATASESKSLGSISWSNVYTFDNDFLGELTSQGLRKLSEADIASGLLLWLVQLRSGDMVEPMEVVNQFWRALQLPKNANPMDWIVASGRDQTKIDRLLKMLPDSLVDLELQIDRVDQENDRIIQRGGLRVGPGMGAGTDRIEITLQLEPDGWRIVAFKHGSDIIEFYP
ncbi:MAG: serine/threonine protein kinase [Pirellula sp.]